jgi:two-component system, cell cycle sensor histidine kinase and response regulator CckA
MENVIRLLLVEDSDDDAELVLQHLKKEGFAVNFERVQNEEDMRTALKRAEWDIVVSDYWMPRFSGLAALAVVKNLGLDLPFIIVSGTIGEEVAVGAMKAGAHDYIMKGTLNRLGPAISRELHESSNRAKLRQSSVMLKQAQKVEAVGRLASGIAHDFNNFLGIVIGYCDLALDSMDRADPAHDYVTRIRGAGVRSASLTQQLLAFCRKQALEPKVLDLNATVNAMKDLLQNVIAESIELASELEPNLGKIEVDPGQLEQVILNLVVNARDAMPQGGKILLRTSNVRMDGSSSLGEVGVPAGVYTLLSVSDTGCGMSEETLSRIFDPFFTTKETDKGTGLGLSTVYGIVGQSNGHIRVTSTVGRGALFRVYFPQTQSHIVEVEKVEAPLSSLKPGSGTILLVEDRIELREILCKMLKNRGYSVLEAPAAPEAQKIIDEQGLKVDLIVTDVVLPGGNGPEIAKALMAVNPGVRVLFMSGYLDDELENYNLLRGRSQFLQKPFSVAQFIEKIQAMLAV